jgi:spermidine/putrescine ABC transporter ATP-binding subunit
MPDTPKPIISVQDVTKRFGSSVVAVDNVNLDIDEGEFFALLGPSGCGKTTLLRMIAGFETLSEGAILIDGEDVSGVEPNQRPINMVFQSYAVFPHMTVEENVGYGLRVVGTPRDEIDSRVSDAIELVRLSGFEKRKPDKLSGGQQQRVALARALVKKPKVLLLDEPLSALDAKLREAMQIELVRLQENVGITFIIVTHDQKEALSMANRIAVMGEGKILQIASPKDLYEYPTSSFVADFIGQVNLFEISKQRSSSSGLTVSVTEIGDVVLENVDSRKNYNRLAIRPEKISVSKEQPDATGLITLPATLQDISYIGDQSHLYFETTAGTSVSVSIQNRERADQYVPRRGEQTWLWWHPSHFQPLTS